MEVKVGFNYYWYRKQNISLDLDLSSSAISKSKSTWTATLGLVVHAAADGIALGNRRMFTCLIFLDFILINQPFGKEALF